VGKADIILAKHRSGGTGEVRLRFTGKYARFENDYDYDTTGPSVLMPNSSFDNTTGSMTIDSKMNIDDDVPF
jgi:replicative DNA helicase